MVSFGGGGRRNGGVPDRREGLRGPGAGECRGSDRRSVRGPGRGRLPGVRAPEHHRRDRLGRAGAGPVRLERRPAPGRERRRPRPCVRGAGRSGDGQEPEHRAAGWEKTFGTLRDWQNCKHGWSRPDDPARARVLQQDFRASREASERRGGRARPKDPRKTITAYVVARIESGSVTDRGSLVAALKEAGLEVPARARTTSPSGTQNHRGAGG